MFSVMQLAKQKWVWMGFFPFMETAMINITCTFFSFVMLINYIVKGQ